MEDKQNFVPEGTLSISNHKRLSDGLVSADQLRTEIQDKVGEFHKFWGFLETIYANLRPIMNVEERKKYDLMKNEVEYYVSYFKKQDTIPQKLLALLKEWHDELLVLIHESNLGFQSKDEEKHKVSDI